MHNTTTPVLCQNKEMPLILMAPVHTIAIPSTVAERPIKTWLHFYLSTPSLSFGERKVYIKYFLITQAPDVQTHWIDSGYPSGAIPFLSLVLQCRQRGNGNAFFIAAYDHFAWA